MATLPQNQTFTQSRERVRNIRDRRTPLKTFLRTNKAPFLSRQSVTMELVAAALGAADVASKASSSLWKLCEKWHNAPRDIFALRDEIDRADRLYTTVQSHILDSSILRSAGSSLETVPAAARELDSLLVQGLGVVSRLHDIICQLLDSTARQVESSSSPPRAKSVLKRRRLVWLRSLPTVRYLKKSLHHNLEQVGVQLVLLNL
jgi:hypothetical protein